MHIFLIITPLCLLAIACNQAVFISTPIVSPQPPRLAINSFTPEAIARQITVKVHVGDRRGSGTIIAKRGHRYVVLTNAHVANKSHTYRITTPDGKIYLACCAQPLKQGTCNTAQNQDLALLEFTSTQNYTVPFWGDSRNLKPGETVYSAGFPFDRQELKIDTSQVSQQTAKPLQGGYQIGFNSITLQGMSGGSLLNSSGQLIGIIGFNAQPILNDGYQYQDGSQPTTNEMRELRKSSFAIPIAALASDRQDRTVLPKQSTATITKANYTGVVKKVDEIAQQITVRIEDKNGGNGSGVIIAREGDTYYVATAAHVVIDKWGYSLITPNQEQIALSEREINIVNKDLDIAIVKFKSKQNYRTAEIGKYEFNKSDWVFVSGFPGKDASKQRHLSIGRVQEREITEFAVKDRRSLSRGNNLIYTNLSIPGMSGGAVLDRQGRLVGINTGAENEAITNQNYDREEINFGYALGIPISTVIGVASPRQVISTSQLQVTNTPAPMLSQSDGKEIQQIQLSTLSKPSQTATAKEWLDYGNLLWRGDRNQEAITAFETAIKLLDRNPEIQDRKEQVRTAYFGLGLAWQRSKQQNFQAAVVAFQQAEKVDPGFYQSSRYLGLSLKKLKRYPEALSAYQRSISKQKDDFVLYVEQGDVLQEVKRYREAVNSYNLAVKLQPNHPWVYNNRGIAYKHQQQYDLAISDYSQAIKIDPQDAAAYGNRGNAYEDLKQYDLAIADHSQAIKIDPQLSGAYNNRGLVYDALKQYPQAISDYNQAIKLRPQSAYAYNNRGNTYKHQQQYDLAISDYNQAIKIDPEYAEPYYNRGSTYEDLKQYPQAISDYNQSIRLDPQFAEAYYNLGSVYDALKQYPQAITDYNQAIKLNPKYAKAYNNRGNIYAKQGKYSQAIADYTQAIQLSPQDAYAYNNRGIAYEDLKQYPQAIADYSQAIKLNPQFAYAYYNRGIAYEDLKQYSQAIADYSQAIKLNPEYAKAYNNRGIAYKKQKQYPQAIADYNLAIKIDPQLAEAYYNRGIAYGLQQQYPQAKTDLAKAAELFRAQNNTAGYQRAMEHLQQLK